MTIQGNGITLFTGTNTYDGGTTVSGGTLQLGSNAALGANSGGLAVNATGVLDINGYSPSVGALNGNGTIDNVIAGGTPTLTIGNGGAGGTFSGTIQNTSGAVMLVKTGGGTQFVTGTNTYGGGTTLQGGVLNFASTANIAYSSSPLPNINFAGGTLQWATGNTVDVSAGIAPIPANVSAGIDTNGNNVTFATALSGSGGLTKTGAGTLTLPVQQTYTGMTTITGGTINVNDANGAALQLSTVNLLANNGLVFTGPAASAGTLGGLAGSANLNLHSTALTVGANNANSAFTGILSNGNSLSKIGSGTFSMSSARRTAGPPTSPAAYCGSRPLRF